jgi:uncharacterized protein YqeY
MTIEKRIETDFITAFKAKNMELKTFLGTIKGEMQTLKKNLMVENLSDEDVVKLLTKFAKGTKETITLLTANTDPFSLNYPPALVSARFELDVLESYLPKQMTEAEINEKLDQLLSYGHNTIAQIMKEFAQLPADKKLVSELARKKMA